MEGAKKKKKVSGLNGKKKRKSRNPILAEREKAREDEAAAKIQAIQRGRVAREKVEELKDEKLDPEKKQGKCYGIALADATDFGPYQAGALIGLLKHQ